MINCRAVRENYQLPTPMRAVKTKLNLEIIMSRDWLDFTEEIKTNFKEIQNRRTEFVGSENGHFYVGRGWLKGALLFGNIYPPDTKLYVCRDGLEHGVYTYQVMHAITAVL